MAERFDTDAQAPRAGNDGVVPPDSETTAAWRTLVIVGLAAASVGVAAMLLRSRSRPPSDPTTERIQALIDEANRLLKQLDEQKNA